MALSNKGSEYVGRSVANNTDIPTHNLPSQVRQDIEAEKHRQKNAKR